MNETPLDRILRERLQSIGVPDADIPGMLADIRDRRDALWREMQQLEMQCVEERRQREQRARENLDRAWQRWREAHHETEP